MDTSAGGLYWVSGLSGTQAQTLVDDLALKVTRGSATGSPLRRPRVGLYRPWNASMDEGWTRWLLERYDFDFQSLRSSGVHADDLRDRYDVMVLPAERPGSLKDGHAAGAVPDRYAGGLGDVGIRALETFVRTGGTLVAMNQASNLVIDEFHLPVRNVVGGLGRQEFFSSGSIMEVESDAAHPVMAGMPKSPLLPMTPPSSHRSQRRRSAAHGQGAHSGSGAAWSRPFDSTHALQSQRRDAVLLRGQWPGCGETR